MSEAIITSPQNAKYDAGFEHVNWSGQDIDPVSGICALCHYIGLNEDHELRCYYKKGRCADEDGEL